MRPECVKQWCGHTAPTAALLVQLLWSCRLAHFIALPHDRGRQMVADRELIISGPCQLRATTWDTSSRALGARRRDCFPGFPFPKMRARDTGLNWCKLGRAVHWEIPPLALLPHDGDQDSTCRNIEVRINTRAGKASM